MEILDDARSYLCVTIQDTVRVSSQRNDLLLGAALLRTQLHIQGRQHTLLRFQRSEDIICDRYDKAHAALLCFARQDVTESKSEIRSSKSGTNPNDQKVE